MRKQVLIIATLVCLAGCAGFNWSGNSGLDTDTADFVAFAACNEALIAKPELKVKLDAGLVIIEESFLTSSPDLKKVMDALTEIIGKDISSRAPYLIKLSTIVKKQVEAGDASEQLATAVAVIGGCRQAVDIH